MKKTLSLRLILTITISLILLIYSSEVSFMPNYVDKPDKWHLMIPMLIFYPILLFSIVRTILKKNIKSQKTEILVLTTMSLIGYAMLNNPKENSQIAGYIILMILLVILILRLFILTSNNCCS